jgi:uncharacterized membrane protein YfcA
MHFPISGVTIEPVYLIALGFFVGILGGFFGVGGSFLAGPALFAFGLPMNFVVGTDLIHIVGKSIVAARKHRALGNIDIRLAVIMVLGTIVGIQVGVYGIEALKKIGRVDWVVGIVAIVVYTGISIFVVWEGWHTSKLPALKSQGKTENQSAVAKDKMAFGKFTQWIQRVPLHPKISLPHSGIKSISIWAILGVSFIGGAFSSFLGGGAGYIRMPCMVYLLGIPTHIAVGTDLFEIVVSASIGSYQHALHGNVDILIALIMQTGASIGAQIGATLTQYFTGPRIRLAFAPLPLLGAGLIVYSLLTGHHTQ